MVYNLVISDEKLENAIGQIENRQFTAFDFAYIFKNLYSDDWLNLTKRYGDPGETGRYNILDYITNRLEYYSQSSHSIIKPIPRFSGDLSHFLRTTTEEEKRSLDRDTIMVFCKK